jgi:hypothetical protein
VKCKAVSILCIQLHEFGDKYILMKLKPEFSDPRPKLLGFYISGPATCPSTPNKEMVMGKGRERRFITWHSQA